MGRVATMPQSKGKNASASRLNPRKIIQKSFFSNVPSGVLYGHYVERSLEMVHYQCHLQRTTYTGRR
jgi:hypothetical protein